MKLLLVLAMLTSGCANMERTQPLNYYPSLYRSSYRTEAPQVRTYWLYNGGQLTPIIQSGPLIMPMTGFGFR